MYHTIILRVAIFVVGCDNNSDDQRLPGIIENESVRLPFCRSLITVMPLFLFLTGSAQTRTDMFTDLHTNASKIQHRPVKVENILIHDVRIGLLFSFASTIATAKAQQPHNASTGARRHNKVHEGANGLRLSCWNKVVHAPSHIHCLLSVSSIGRDYVAKCSPSRAPLGSAPHSSSNSWETGSDWYLCILKCCH